KAVQLVRRLRPEAVLGVGGYAGGPIVLVAAALRIPTVVLEPNAKPGFTNRVLKPFVRHAACSYEETRREFGSKGVVTGNPVREAEVLAFLDDMATRFAQADLVLCRSGATTAAELTAAGKAAVLVPFARAADDHQRGNARALEAAGAARMIEEKDLTPERLAA